MKLGYSSSSDPEIPRIEKVETLTENVVEH